MKTLGTICGVISILMNVVALLRLSMIQSKDFDITQAQINNTRWIALIGNLFLIAHGVLSGFYGSIVIGILVATTYIILIKDAEAQ